MQNATNAVNNFNGTVGRAGAAAGQAGAGAAAATTRVQAFGNAMLSAGKAAGAMALTLAPAAALMEEALRRSSNEALDFEATMRNVNSIARLGEADFADLSARTLDLAGSMDVGGKDAQDLSKALYDVFSSNVGIDKAATAQVNMERALNVTKLAAQGARAGLATTAETARGFLAVLNSYRMANAPIEDLSHVMDIMFETVNRGVVTFPELADGIGVVTNQAHVVGLSIEELGAAIAQLTVRGLEPQMAMYALNSVLMDLLTPTDQQRNMMELLTQATGRTGVEMSVSAVKAQGFAGWLENVTSAAQEFTDQQNALGNATDISEVFAKIIPEARAARAFISIGSNVGEFKDALDAMNNSSRVAVPGMEVMGSTMAALSQQAKSGRFSLDVLGATVGKLAVTVGDRMIPSIAAFATNMTQLVSQFQKANPVLFDWIIAVGTALVAVTAILGVIAAVALALGGLALAGISGTLVLTVLAATVGVVTGAIVAINLVMSAWQKNFLGVRDRVADAVNFLTNFIRLLQEAQRNIKIGFDLGPTPTQPSLGAAIGAAGEGTSLTGRADPMRDVWIAIGILAREVLTAITTFLGRAVDAWNAIVKRFQDGWTKLTTEIGSVITRIGDWFAQIRFAEAWAGAMERVGAAVDTVIGWLRILAGFIASVILARMDDLGGLVTAVFDGLTEGIHGAADAVGAILGPVFETLGPTFALLGDTLGSLWKMITDALGPALQVLVGLVGVTLVGAWAAFMGILRGVAKMLGPLIQMIGTVLAGAIQVAVGAFQTLVGIVSIVVGLVTGNGDMMRRGFDQIGVGAGNMRQGVLNALGGLVTGIPAIMSAFVAGLWEGFSSSLLNLATRLATDGGPVSGVVKGILTGFYALVDQIGGFFDALGTAVQNGIAAVGAFFDGLGTKAHQIIDDVIAAIGKFFSDLGTAVKTGADNIAALWSVFWDRPLFWIGYFVTKAVSAILSFFENLVITLIIGFQNVTSTIATWIAARVADWNAFWGNIGTTVNQFFNGGGGQDPLGTRITLGFVAATIAIATWVQDRINSWNAFWKGIGTAVDQFFNGGPAGPALETRVNTGFVGATTTIETWVQNRIHDFKQMWDDIGAGIDKFFNGPPSLGERIADWIKAMVPAVLGALGDFKTQLWNGITGGINSALEGAKAQVKKGVQQLIDGANAAAGNDSPSKKMAEVGRNMMAGLAVGIGQGHDSVRNALLDAGDLLAPSGSFLGEVTQEKRLVVLVDVTSSDGSVSALQLDQVREVAEQSVGDVLGVVLGGARRSIRQGRIPEGTAA